MVVVKVGDGLGNQMYNYVCGYSVAKHDDDELLLDTSEVDNSTFRSYGLEQFNIDFTRRESFSNRTVFHKIYKRIRRSLKYDVISEPAKGANSLFMEVYRPRRLRNKYLYGYFQNYHYYETCKAEIDRQFTPREPFCDGTAHAIEQLLAGNTCSLHIRGGDIPPLPISYYRRAVELVRSKRHGVRFVVFGNERETAEEYMRLLEDVEHCFIWDMGSFSDFEELFLMKACRSHIISDSTFSRWAALLDEKGGICVAPEPADGGQIYPQGFEVLKTGR